VKQGITDLNDVDRLLDHVSCAYRVGYIADLDEDPAAVAARFSQLSEKSEEQVNE
jgi:hypothetical protein